MPRRCLHGVHLRMQTETTSRCVFASALPARGASSPRTSDGMRLPPLPRRCLHGVHPHLVLRTVCAYHLCLGAACTGCIDINLRVQLAVRLCLGAACTGCIGRSRLMTSLTTLALPRRCLHGVHLLVQTRQLYLYKLCLGAACTGCIHSYYGNI